MFLLRFIIAAFAVLSAASADNLKPREYYLKLFYEHIHQFKLDIKDGMEFVKRVAIFAKNVDLIEIHNMDPTATYSMAINQFAHLSFHEFLDTVHVGGTRRPGLRHNLSGRVHDIPSDPDALPEAVDWADKGGVTPIKNQGMCGSCWAFSAVGAMEGAYFLKHGNLTALSEQQLVSCAPSPNAGCNGGWMDDAFAWATENGGLAAEEDYPYTSGTFGKTGECEEGHKNVPNSAPKDHVDVKKDVSALMSAVAQQPVAIAIEADQIAFQFYRSGVLTGKCGQNLDHGVLLVGYGQHNGVDFWKVKNSWGELWGDRGYVLIERSSANKCGVLEAASYPVY